MCPFFEKQLQSPSFTLRNQKFGLDVLKYPRQEGNLPPGPGAIASTA